MPDHDKGRNSGDLKLSSYESLIANTMAPLQAVRVRELARAQESATALHARAEALSLLFSHVGPTPYRPLVDLGMGLQAAAEVDASQPLLVDVGAGVHVAMEPEEALVYSRMVAAQARSQAALAEKALQDVSADLHSACESLLQLQRLLAQDKGGKQ
jgi:prefoldin subunit 5